MYVYKWKHKSHLQRKRKEGNNTVLPLFGGGFPVNDKNHSRRIWKRMAGSKKKNLPLFFVPGQVVLMSIKQLSVVARKQR